MEDIEPESQCLSLQVRETARWARELSVSFREGSPEPGGQQVGRRNPQFSRQNLQWPMPREIRVAWGSTLESGVWLYQQWSATCFSYRLKVEYSTLLGLFDKCLGTPDAKWGMYPGACGWYTIALLNTPVGKCGISPGAYLWVVPLCRPVCSGLMCRYLRCVSLPDVSALT